MRVGAKITRGDLFANTSSYRKPTERTPLELVVAQGVIKPLPHCPFLIKLLLFLARRRVGEAAGEIRRSLREGHARNVAVQYHRDTSVKAFEPTLIRQQDAFAKGQRCLQIAGFQATMAEG